MPDVTRPPKVLEARTQEQRELLEMLKALKKERHAEERRCHGWAFWAVPANSEVARTPRLNFRSPDGTANRGEQWFLGEIGLLQQAVCPWSL